ncbi:FG-GAP-like repeat-containing protein [Pelagicoccus sp. SDUM812002]|uniref:FG-GAP-like repeat-containing protein n=1 Tax=Pelagicoccus sp. SDUM812002 TaxID=3041266 RepID=UPI00280FCFA5|nr:FG-GAP-like repeat-containing protein [Pelagicoccus sp. SDUM812002]MDQ8186053.1 FG-GAP-like repeat-containing protein [Pelagicoccus sp. SDUM812002]
MRRTLSLIPYLVLVMCFLLCPLDVRAGFSNHIVASGLDYIQADSKSTKHGGAAAVDVDGDGYTDILVARDEKTPLLFINQGDGTFSDETTARGLGAIQDIGGFGAGDFDNDGDQDLFASPRLGNRYYLFINDGAGNFSEEAVARGAAVETTLQVHRGYSVGLVDFDLDGYLDIYASEWGVISNADDAKHSVLLRNKGSGQAAHFENVTEQAGLAQPISRNMHFAFASAWGDFDGDGWPDLMLVSDFGTSKMYWNNGDGTFLESTDETNVGLDENGMGVAIVDYDQDGKLDIFVSSIYDRYSNRRDGSHTGNKLYKNLGNRMFSEVSAEALVARSGWGWGSSFFEYDNDGDSDLVVTNGSIVSAGLNPDSNPYVEAADDPTALYLNQSDGTFLNGTVAAGLDDRELGKAIVVFDYEEDGDEDLFITNSGDHPILYRSDASGNGNRFLRLSFEGTLSNRDGYGCIVEVVTGDRIQTQLYNPSNAYIGQREPFLHFGLGQAASVDSIEVLWPSGAKQNLEDVAVDQVLKLVEPDAPLGIPSVSVDPVGGTFEVGEEFQLSVEATGDPEPVVIWERNGKIIAGANGHEFRIKRVTPFDAGEYRAKVTNSQGEVYSSTAVVAVDMDVESHSVARLWNEFMLGAIRTDFPNPTKHGRNLYHVSAAMWDAFWAYEVEAWSKAKPMFLGENILEENWGGDRLAAQREAISHAAFTVLSYRYKKSPGAEGSLYGFRWLMEELGFNPDDISTEGMSPAAVGNRIGQRVLDENFDDGSNELNGYVDTSGYEVVNDPLVLDLPGAHMDDINRWQPLAFDYAVSQNGIPIGALVQSFLGVNWREVETFAMKKTTHNTIAFDPGPPPQMGTETQDAFIDSAIEVIRYSSYLDPEMDDEIDISPGALLNNPLATNGGTGRALNPFTGEPYAENKVKHADYGRILAEFWADGPASETPPGHWNSLHNEISDDPRFSRKYMGVGDELSKLEWDVRAYLALNGGMHDAAVAAWTLKRQYDYSRPISMIRELCGRGQSSDSDGPSYAADGIRLEDGLIEVITEESAAEGQRHAHLSEHVGEIAIRAWAGEPEDSHHEVGGVDWMLGENWFPYQRSTFVTPAFGAYVSGHSTFSRTGAEVMTLLTGSPFFPGGLGEFNFPKSEFLEFEDGPSEDVTLQWATYYDAADQAGLSRLYGGIHVRADDFIGRTLGARIGVEAFLRAHSQRHANASKLGLIKEIRHMATVRSGEASTLARFDSEGIPLRFKGAHSFSDETYKDQDGIYVQLPNRAELGDAVPNRLVMTGVGPLLGADFQTTLSEGESLSVEIEVELDEPTLVLFWGEGSSLGKGILDTRIRVYSVSQDGGETQIGANDDWQANDISSQAEVLILRDSQDKFLDEKDAAVSVCLESGAYRFELEALEGAGPLVLSVRSQVWRDSN